MNKLQLYITMANGGYETKFQANPDQAILPYIGDLTPVVRQVSYPQQDMCIFYLLKYVEQGMFVVVLRTIPPKEGDHLAAWIYLPYSIKIDNASICAAVDLIAKKVGSPEIRERDLDEIDSYFSKEYPANPRGPIFPPSQGQAVAYRYYGPRTGCTLHDLVGQYRCQTSYLPFAGVLLVDHDITSDVAGANLTSATPDAMAVLYPPLEESIEGYHPTIYSRDFAVPYYVPMMRNIDVVWEKKGENDIKQTLYIGQPEMRTPKLKLQNQAAQMHAEHTPTDKTEIPPRKKTYRFQIPAKSADIGTVIEFEITTNSELEGSPIDGYEPTSDLQEGAGRSNHLSYKADNRWHKIVNNALYAVGGLIVGVVATLICTCGSNHEEAVANNVPKQDIEVVEAGTPMATIADEQPKEPSQPEKSTEQVKETPKPDAAPAESQGDVSLEAAIKYLDANPTWKREEMEKYPELRGLYDDMNNIERQKLVEVWGPKLAESRMFTTLVVKHSRQSYKKTPRKKPYNAPGEAQMIRIQNYLNTIDP